MSKFGSHAIEGTEDSNKLRQLAWHDLPAGSVQLQLGLLESTSLETAIHKHVCLNNA